MTCDMPVMGYVPIAGTHAFEGGWWKDEAHPFPLMMAANGFRACRRSDGSPFRWSTALDGLFGGNDDWEAAADALRDFLDVWVPRQRDRNLICHSHGGQVGIILAARGVPIRSLVTVGTPCRPKDVPAIEAATLLRAHGGVWIHIYDRKRDWTQLLGQVGTGDLDRQRAFNLRDSTGGLLVYNAPMDGIKHSNVLNKEKFLHYWKVNGWLETIRTLAAPNPAAV